LASKAENIVHQMYIGDLFSQWLGIRVLDIKEGHCRLQMLVRKEMLNGFSILHGGVTFSLADSALAFASNSHGRKAVSIDASMSYVAQVREGDIITAIAREEAISAKTGVYNIVVTNQHNETIAVLKGTVYRTSKEWVVSQD
jgi:acyl-CoA thioesterase